jgi:NADH:ubiquinone oxidoreductase subunit 6 (subunit J)
VIDHYAGHVNICMRFLCGVVGVCFANRKMRRRRNRMLVFASVIAVLSSLVIVVFQWLEELIEFGVFRN